MRKSNYLEFDVPGFTRFRISNDPNCITGVDTIGFQFDHERKFGAGSGPAFFSGGVLSREDAIKLALHIINTIRTEDLKTFEEVKQFL